MPTHVAEIAPPAPAPRVPLAALLAASVPVLAGFSLLLGFVIAEASGARPFARPPAANVAEAASYGEAAGVLGFIARGDDVNQRWDTRADLFDARGPMKVTAVQAAILQRRAEVVALLLRRGARAENPTALACLAQAVGQERELPPSVFGMAERRYYDGPVVGGRDAFVACGLPFE
jgi:hypothetical protein